MKILMTTDTLGGVWNYSVELCRQLEFYKIELHLVALGAWPSREQREQIAACENVTLYKSDFKLEWMQHPWEDVGKSRKWINCIYHTIQPNLVHLNNYTLIEESWTCPVVTVFHSCVATWWKSVKETYIPKTWDTYLKIVKTTLNTSTVVVAPTQAILEQAIDAHTIYSTTLVIHNGSEIDKSLPLSKEEFILCIGRIWDEAKNLKILSQVATELPWPIYIAGDNVDPNSGEVWEIANVKFLGKLQPEQVKSWMQRASIFVSPTKYEPFGLAILEAANAGCALALSNLETLKEIWQDDAVYFDPKNASQLKRVLLQLIGSKTLRNEMAIRSKRAAKAYSSKKMALEYYQLYTKLIKNKREPKEQLSHSFHKN